MNSRPRWTAAFSEGLMFRQPISAILLLPLLQGLRMVHLPASPILLLPSLGLRLAHLPARILLQPLLQGLRVAHLPTSPFLLQPPWQGPRLSVSLPGSEGIVLLPPALQSEERIPPPLGRSPCCGRPPRPSLLWAPLRRAQNWWNWWPWPRRRQPTWKNCYYYCCFRCCCRCRCCLTLWRLSSSALRSSCSSPASSHPPSSSEWIPEFRVSRRDSSRLCGVSLVSGVAALWAAWRTMILCAEAVLCA
mmetsp:Transcript_97167/g.119008  ORF Transcript_97167/g.119008 Transcript_97167/m.119008 type:complete len:247 (-) Transcript_97167:366-1106(-)